jgi:hypothetical protein
MSTQPANRPPAEFVDKHMVDNVEGSMIYTYAQRNFGAIPSPEQLKDFVSALSQSEILRIVREHPGHKSLQQNLRNDADVLRWANTLK